MQAAISRAASGLAVLLLVLPGSAAAQSVELGGRAYIDYFYTLTSPDKDLEGFHGFTYRRLYLTADAVLSEAFEARARLEANDGTAGDNGPIPFVKDLWVAWTFTGDHVATIGVQPPPAFEMSEDVWGYRSLEQTILDLQGINSSRDFGLRFDGPLAQGGAVRYALMYANNSAAQPETDDYKRGYAQLSFHPTRELRFSVGADHAGYGDARDSDTRVSAFGGYVADAFRFGAEAFWYALHFEGEDEFTNRGVSLFGAVLVASQWELVGRIDLTSEGPGGDELGETFVLAGAAYSPIENVRIIPNLWLFDTDADEEAKTLGRLTVEVNF